MSFPRFRTKPVFCSILPVSGLIHRYFTAASATFVLMLPRPGDQMASPDVTSLLATRDTQDDVARFLLGLDVPCRFDRVLEGVAPIDDRAVFPRFDELLEKEDLFLRVARG